MAGEKQPSKLSEEINQTPVPKRSWPELVGQTAEEAEKKIKEEMPFAMVQVIPKDSFVTMDFRCNRVRIFVDSSRNVARPPIIG